MPNSAFQKNGLILTILLFFSVLTRVPYGGIPLTGDEGITFNHYAFNSWKDLVFNYTDTNQHTLFSLLSNISLKFFGENEWSFRLPSILAGILAVPLTYWVGIKFLNSRLASFIAAVLILFSSPHLIYSQAGRGYSLTVILALLFIGSICKLVEFQNNWKDGSIFFLSGLGLVVALPSNGLFLAGSAFFSFFLILDGQKDNLRSLVPTLKKLTSYFLVLLFAVSSYLYCIKEGLQAGVHNYSNELPVLYSLKIFFNFFKEPFPFWIYAFFLLGIFFFTNRQKLFAILSLLIVPLAIMLVFGTIGYQRIYIFILPFVFFITAVGIESIFNKLFFKRSRLKAIIGFVLISVFFVPVVKFGVQYYPDRANIKEATISEARQISDYIRENIPGNALIISLLGSQEKSVLIHYLEKRLSNEMFQLLNGGKLEKIFVVAYKDPPEDEFRLGSFQINRFLTIPKESLNRLDCKGKICLYEWEVKFNRLIPPAVDLDYETKITFPKIPQLEVQSLNDLKILGDQSLLIKHRSKQGIKLATTEVKTVQFKNDGYFLLAFLRPFGQKSYVNLWDRNKSEEPSEMAYLNPYMGRVALPDQKEIWQMVYLLYPIKKGRHNLAETFYLNKKENKFDGIQSFFITLR
jgi:hypothetical protein